jgi:hypothetical protein
MGHSLVPAHSRLSVPLIGGICMGLLLVVRRLPTKKGQALKYRNHFYCQLALLPYCQIAGNQQLCPRIGQLERSLKFAAKGRRRPIFNRLSLFPIRPANARNNSARCNSARSQVVSPAAI